MTTEFEFKVSGMDAVNRDLGSFASKMAATAIPVAAVGAALASGMAAARDFAKALEEQTGVLRAFNGSVEEARERTSGLVSRMQLIEASNKAAQAGLQLSARSLANLAVAADEFAGATGGDTVAALDQLTQAISVGQVRALKQYGIEIDASKSKTEKQRLALEAIAERYGTVTAKVDTLGGALEQMGVAIDDAQTDFIDGFQTVDMLQGGFADLAREANSFVEALGLASGPGGISLFTQGGIVAATMLDGLMRRLGAFVRAVQQASTGDFSGAQRELGTAFGSMQTEITAGSNAFIRAGAARAAREGAASVSQDRITRPGGSDGGGGRSRADRMQAFAEQLQGDAGVSRVGFGAGEAIGMKLDAPALTREEFPDFDKTLITAQDIASADERRAIAVAEQNESLAEQQDLLKGIGSNMMALGTAMFEQGPKKAFKAWAKQFAIQQGGLAIEALAMAAPLLLTPGGQATGGAYLERAALHGAAAAAVGAAGAAVSSGRSRGGGGGSRPEQPSSMAGSGGQTVPNQIVVNINSPVPESELGRMNARAKQEAERRFGA